MQLVSRVMASQRGIQRDHFSGDVDEHFFGSGMRATVLYMPALRILNYGNLNIGRPIIDYNTILISARPPSLSYSSPASNFVAAML